jgi:hypothetical protein
LFELKLLFPTKDSQIKGFVLLKKAGANGNFVSAFKHLSVGDYKYGHQSVT